MEQQENQINNKQAKDAVDSATAIAKDTPTGADDRASTVATADGDTPTPTTTGAATAATTETATESGTRQDASQETIKEPAEEKEQKITGDAMPVEDTIKGSPQKNETLETGSETKPAAPNAVDEPAEEEGPTGDGPKEETSVKDEQQKQEALPIKRARTAYFIFAAEKRPELQKKHPGEGVAVVAKALGQMWSALSDEERQVYQHQAAEERTRVQAELQARQAAGTLPEATKAPTDPAALGFPLARVRKIIKLDPEVQGVQRDAVLLISKAAELALIRLGRESVRVAHMQNRRKLLPDDVAQVCQVRPAFAFLKDDLQDLVAQQQEEHAKTAAAAAGSKKRKAEASVPSANRLTSYFAVKPKDSSSSP